MKCPSCHGEWTPPKNISLSNCPFCQIDILQSFSGQVEKLSPEVILRNMLQIYGNEILQQEQKLMSIISELFAHDIRTKKMLLISVKEKVPQHIIGLKYNKCEDNINVLKLHLKNEAFLNDETTTQIIAIWSKLFEFEDPDEPLQLVSEKSKFAFKNSLGTIIPFKYDFTRPFKEGVACVALFERTGERYGYAEYNQRWGVIDKYGEEIIPLEYEEIESFSEGLACAKLNGKYGFINKYGHEVIPFKYYSANSFKEGMAVVWLNGKCGFIDKKGKEVIPLKYEFAYDFSENLACVRLNKLEGFIDKQGKTIIPFKYISAHSFSEELASVMRWDNKNQERWGFIDKQGNEKIPFKYENAHMFCEGLACVLVYDNPVTCADWGYIDKQGKLIIKDSYKEANSFNNGFATVYDGSTWRIIDKNERVIKSFEYYNGIGEFSEGLALVLYNERFGYVNMQGEEVISVKYEDAYPFSEGFACVKLNGKWGFIDKKERRTFR